MENLQGKVAFITGGASGIGLGIAKACVRHGMKVVIADLRQEALDEAMAFFKNTNSPVHPIQLDVTDREAYARAADEAEEVFGKIHVLVNNAGVAAGRGPLYNASYKEWDFIISININGVINGIATIVPRILAHGEGGHVVSTSSTGGIIAVKGAGLYNTTKYAVTGLMESLASDLEGTNVGASVFCPGPVASNLGQSSFQVMHQHYKDEMEKREDGQVPPTDSEWAKKFMSHEEVGERVVRGIKRNDLFIWTHPEFKDGIVARNEALIRAIPDEPYNEDRHIAIKHFGQGTLTYNKVYDTQTQVEGLDWNLIKNEI